MPERSASTKEVRLPPLQEILQKLDERGAKDSFDRVYEMGALGHTVRSDHLVVSEVLRGTKGLLHEMNSEKATCGTVAARMAAVQAIGRIAVAMELAGYENSRIKAIEQQFLNQKYQQRSRNL